MILRKGNVNNAVKKLQQLLKDSGFDPGTVDGWFGAKTESAVIEFQKSKTLQGTGIVDDETWGSLGVANPPKPKQPSMSFISAPADVYKDGYSNFHLREDAAAAYRRVYDGVHLAGGIIPSSGAKRELNAVVGKGRSATSLHYTGRAIDLFIASAMQKPETDPLVVVADAAASNKNLWRVYVKAGEGKGEELTLEAYKYTTGKTETKKVSGWFLDLTGLFDQNGFKRIGHWSSWPKEYITAEWWHFQYVAGLALGKTTFGDELLKVYPEARLAETPPWKYRDYIFNGSGFAKV
jgi:hypothetical protein